MSLILEALKKSEAQRRLGEMPNLGTPITATKRRRSALPWLALGTVVVLAAAGGWRFLGQRAAPVPPATNPAPGKPSAKADGSTPPTSPTAPRQVIKAPASAAPPAAANPPPPAQPKKDMAPPTPATLPVAAPPPAAVPAPAPAQAPAPVATPPPAAAHPPAPAPPAPPPVNDVPTVDELPPELRSALPVLPITMQVYSPDPKRRFAIIDGTRVVEGESIRGVTVQEIRPAGLVLEFQGRRVLLPRPGS